MVLRTAPGRVTVRNDVFRRVRAAGLLQDHWLADARDPVGHGFDTARLGERAELLAEIEMHRAPHSEVAAPAESNQLVDCAIGRAPNVILFGCAYARN
jgi:hypothetical protein